LVCDGKDVKIQTRRTNLADPLHEPYAHWRYGLLTTVVYGKAATVDATAASVIEYAATLPEPRRAVEELQWEGALGGCNTQQGVEHRARTKILVWDGALPPTLQFCEDRWCPDPATALLLVRESTASGDRAQNWAAFTSVTQIRLGDEEFDTVKQRLGDGVTVPTSPVYARITYDVGTSKATIFISVEVQRQSLDIFAPAGDAAAAAPLEGVVLPTEVRTDNDQKQPVHVAASSRRIGPAMQPRTTPLFALTGRVNPHEVLDAEVPSGDVQPLVLCMNVESLDIVHAAMQEAEEDLDLRRADGELGCVRLHFAVAMYGRHA
jgi:hypothetical protein